MPLHDRHLLRTLFAAVLVNGCISGGFSQGELDNEIKEFYRNEQTLALEANSQGWGFGFRYGRRQDGFRKRLYDVSFTTVRHAREVKLAGEAGRFVYGKLNSMYSLQATVGQQKEHFGKFDRGGVAIRSVVQAGACVAIVKPYYYIMFNSDGEKVAAQYSADNTDIYAKAPYFYGIGQSYFMPGACARASASFEFGRTDKRIKALELGIAGHIYPQVIKLMATEDNRFWFVNVFAAYRIGRIVGRN